MANNGILTLQLEIKNVVQGLNTVAQGINDLKNQIRPPLRVTFDNTQITDGIQAVQNQVQQFAEQTKSSITRSMGEIGFALTAVITSFNLFKNSTASLIAASNQQEQATNNLKAALATLNQATDANIASYQQFATLMQNTANVGDEVVLGMLSLATSMGIVDTKRKDAVKGAIGLSKAYGIDLQTALKGIALAYDGEYSLLSRQLPALRAAQTETEKMAVLQKAMADGFAIAKAEMGTGVGALERLKNQYSDFQEKLGDIIKDLLMPLVGLATSILQSLNDHATAVKVLVGAISLMTIGTYAHITALKKGILVKVTDTIATYKSAVGAATYFGSLKLLTGGIWLNIKAIVAHTAALIASPIGWAAITIAALIAGISLFTHMLFKSREETEKHTKATNDFADSTTDATNVILNNSKRLKAQYEKERRDLHELKYDMEQAVIAEYRAITEIRPLTEKEWAESNRRLKEIGDNYLAATADLRQKIVYEQISILEVLRKATISEQEQIEQATQEHLGKLDDLLKAGILTAKEHAEDKLLIEKNKNTELRKLYYDDRHARLEIARQQVELNEITQDKYKSMVTEYYNWVKGQYGKDTKEYLDALKMKVDLTKQALADIQAIQNRLKTTFQSKEDAITEQYNKEKETLEKTRELNKNYYTDMAALFNDYQLALNDLRQKAADDEKRKADEEKALNKQLKEDALELAEKRVEIGKKGSDQLKQAADDYLQYCKATYGEDSIEFYDALQRKQQAYEKAANAALGTYQTISEKVAEAMEKMQRSLGDFGEMAAACLNSVAESAGNMFDDMIYKNVSFGKALTNLWKDLIRTLINELNKLIVKLTVVAALKAALNYATGGTSGAITAAIEAVGAASGGYIRGPGTATSDSIPARLSNGEYVINAAKTRLFKPLLDVINYSPIPAIKKMFNDYAATIHFPTYAYATPRYSYASGGMVTGGGFPSFDAMNERLDQVISSIEHLTTQTTNQMERLNQKDYNVNVTTKFKGVEFAREMVKAQKEYMEIHK